MALSALSGKPLNKSEIPAFKIRAAEIDDLRQKAPAAMGNKPELVAQIVEAPSNYVVVP